MTGRVLVTGLRGFTGSYLELELKAAGYEVCDLLTKDGHPVDITDRDAVRDAMAHIKPRAIIHLAAVAFVGHGDPNTFYAVNLIGTRNLLEAAHQTVPQLDLVVLASSANIYGNRTAGVLDEDAPADPVNDYAVSKLAMEQMAALWRERLPIIVTRPFNYTGHGQSTSFLIPKIVAHFRARAPRISLGNLDVGRDFSDVRAVVQVYRDLLAAKPIGRIVNICSGNCYSPRDVLAMAQSITGHAIEVDVDPGLVRANEVTRLYGNPSRLRALLPQWQPIPFETTLRWMLEAG
jgi:nucleoside-diphosphate-sugar epimerase